MNVDPSLSEYTELQEQECKQLLQLFRDMGIATADRAYAPGDAVYREGEYGDALYVLTSGVLKVFRPSRERPGSGPTSRPSRSAR